VAQFDPMQMALEAAFTPRPFVTIAGGLTWKHWSAFPLPSENATMGAPPQRDPGFHDTAVPRIAVELRRQRGPLRLVGRAGYFFEWSPAPVAISAQATLLDADRHVVTAGAGLEWRHRYGALQLDFFGQLHQLAGSPRVDGRFYVLGATVGVDL
jgi:hypothetical protein